MGYYVNNDYTDPELRENPPEIPQFDKVCVKSNLTQFSCFQVKFISFVQSFHCQTGK